MSFAVISKILWIVKVRRRQRRRHWIV